MVFDSTGLEGKGVFMFKKGIVILFIVFAFSSLASAKTEIIFWHTAGYEEITLVNKLVDMFNQTHPQIKVIPKYIGPSYIQNYKFLVGIEAKSTPDILLAERKGISQIIDTDRVLPLDEFIEKELDKDDLYPLFWEGLKDKGNTWGVPLYIYSKALIYNQELFKEGGLKEFPQSWEELLRAAQRLTKDLNSDGKTDQYGLEINPLESFLNLLFSRGGELFSKDLSEAKFNSSQGVESLQFLVNLINKYKVSPGELHWSAPKFEKKEVGMKFASLSDILSLKEKGVKVGLIPSSAGLFSLVDYDCALIFRTTPEKERSAWEFIKWFVDKDLYSLVCQEANFLPLRKSIGKTLGYQEYLKKHPEMEVFISNLDYAYTLPLIPEGEEIYSCLEKAVNLAIYEGEKPEVVLEQAAKEINRRLKKSIVHGQ